MSHRFTRQELYDLVWSEPMKNLAQRFGLSDVGLAKACKKANIPRPPRGYWAKLKAGKKLSRQPLSARGPGMSDEVEVGGGSYHYYCHLSEEDILNSNPQPPVFEDDLEDVATRVQGMVGHVTVPKMPDRAHRQIRRLLDADEERRQKQLSSCFSYSWDKPLFDDPFEKRRLRVLNAIMTALEVCGMKPTVQGGAGRNLSVRVNDTHVHYTLDATSQKNDPYRDASVETRGTSNKLRLQILSWGPSSGVHMSWEDTDKIKLEKHLDDIVIELIASGERQYREYQQRHYEWVVKRKADLIEEIRKREEEAKRKERERRIALEKARVDRLLGDATALRQAADIRTYVEAVRQRCSDEDNPVSADELEAWASWALAQADRLDPVRSGRFVQRMKDPEEPNEDENGTDFS